MAFPNVIHGSEEETLNTYTAERFPVGSKMEIEDGRIFRFAEAGATALEDDELTEAVAPSANFLDEAVATLAAGVLVLTGVGSTTGNGAVNLFRYGYVWSSTATNANPLYRIKSNILITAGATSGTITLFVPTVAAYAAADTITYIENPWRDIIVATATTAAGVHTGVPAIDIAANAFGWVQTRGPALVLIAGVVVLGNPVIVSGTAGAVGPAASQTTNLTGVIGRCIAVEATTEHGPIFLQLE